MAAAIPASRHVEDRRDLDPAPPARRPATAAAASPGPNWADRALLATLCRAKTRTWALSWRFLCLSGCSPVLADQAVDDLSTFDPGANVDRLAGLVQRRSLPARLVRPVLVVMLRVLGQDPPEVVPIQNSSQAR